MQKSRKESIRMLVKETEWERRAQSSKHISKKYSPDFNGGGKGERRFEDIPWSLVERKQIAVPVTKKNSIGKTE